MFDGLGDAILGTVLAVVFLFVLAIALAIAFALTWFGFKTAALWAAGAGVLAAWVAAKFVRSRL